MLAPSLQVTRTGADVPLEGRARLPKNRLFLYGVLVIFAVGWQVSVRAQLERRAQEVEGQSLELGARIFQERVGETQRKLAAISQLIAEDPRLKATLATPDNRGAIKDVLSPLARRVAPSVLCVVGADGRVIVSSGDDRLAGLDLSPSEVFRGAVDSNDARTSLWGFKSGLLAVAATAVKFGDTTMAVVLAFDPVDASSLQQIGRSVGADAGLVVSDRLTYQTNTAHKMLLEGAKNLVPGATARLSLGDQRFLVRAEDISERALPSRVIWIRAIHPATDLSTSALLWMPVIASVLLGCLYVWRSGSSPVQARTPAENPEDG